MKILSIVGARPQFIKAAVVSRLIRAEAGVTEYLVHTGQHYDEKMSEIFFQELSIPEPDENLGVGSNHQGAQTAEMLTGIEAALLREKPDMCLVYGDTNSTLAGGLAAAKLHIPLAHIEAGLRSFNKRMPEEINRVTVDHCSNILFSTSSVSTANLQKEGVKPELIVEAGDVMFDAVLFYAEDSGKHEAIVENLGLQSKQFALATIHRAENTDDPTRLANIFDALAEFAKDIKVVLPLHPRTKAVLEKRNLLAHYSERIQITEPLGYLEMLQLQKYAALVATDSGGVQKEAYYLETPCVTLRDETEWVELVEGGFNALCSPAQDAKEIVAVLQQSHSKGFQEKGKTRLYGGGTAGLRIAEAIMSFS